LFAERPQIAFQRGERVIVEIFEPLKRRLAAIE